MRNHLLKIYALTLWLTAAAAAVGASSPTDASADPGNPALAPAERLEALLYRFQKSSQEIDSMEASFVQRKESALLVEEQIAEGRFSFLAPDKVRWEYLEPDPISMTIVDGEMLTWYRDLGQAEKMIISSQAERILAYLGAGSSIQELLQYFDVSLRVSRDETAPYELELLPRYPRVAKRLQQLNVRIDPSRFVVTGLRYVEPDGDVTEYEFGAIELNGDVPSDLFELALPGSVDLRIVEFGAAGR